MEEIEREIGSTEAKLAQLPRRLIRESGGTLGFRAYQKGNEPERAWVEVDLQESREFDAVVLVPAVIIDETQGSSNFAFPADFQIRIYASLEDPTGQLLFDTTAEPLHCYPDRAPVIIDCPGASARRIRFIPLELHKVFDLPQQIYTLSELLVFKGPQNLALGKPVTARNWTKHSPIWHKDYLTDGYMPFTVPGIAEDGEINGCRMLVPNRDPTPAAITLDLGHERTLDEIRLYPFQADHNFAVFHKLGMGFPRRFKIEVSADADFTSPALVFDSGADDYPSPGHRLACFSAHGASGRFVRVTAGRLPSHPRKSASILAFAEIEVLSDGQVVSHKAEVRLSHSVDIPKYPPAMLVDGRSANGAILPLRSWLAGLSERNRLEARLAGLENEQTNRYLRQSRVVRGLSWGIGIVTLITLAVYLWQRQLRQRQLHRLREDLAADLHDEIGSNFSGIALLADELSSDENIPPANLSQLSNIANISRSSANNTRAMVRFLESRQVNGKLLDEMRNNAEVMLAQHAYVFEVEGGKHVGKLEPKDEWNLLLFFKEALNNIVKHAEATEVVIRMQFTPRQLTLRIADNGRGLADHQQPAHLVMRAEKLHARLTLEKPPEGGTIINLEKSL